VEVPYGNVKKLVENQDCLYIYFGTMTAAVVPLSSFDGDHPYADFRACLEDKIRSAKTMKAGSEAPSGASSEQ